MSKLLYLLLLIIPFASEAQKQGNVWYFGGRHGLDFSSGAPVALTGGMTGTAGSLMVSQEGSSCVSDSSGKLLFYTGGYEIWNRKHKAMPNGSGLAGDRSSTQESIIVPQPGSNSIFYVFTTDVYENYFSPTRKPKGYRYSIVDMCLDSNRGDVIIGKKNILLTDTGTEKICACNDGQQGYWIMGHRMFSNEFRAWHLTISGITDSVVSRIGYVYDSSNYAITGPMKFNPDGNKLAVALNGTPGAGLELFDFNPSTGVLSNMCHAAIDSPENGVLFYGLEFSADGSKLYISLQGNTKRLYQYNMIAGGGSCSAILASRQTLFNTINPNLAIAGMQSGPDGKIYVCVPRTAQNNIGRINFPNLAGSAAGFDTAAIVMPGFGELKALPSFIAGFKYRNAIPCAKPIISGIESIMNDVVDFYPNPVKNSGILSISAHMDIQGMQLSIVDAFGRTIKKIVVNMHRLPIDLHDAVSGVYFYQLKQNGRLLKAGKIIVE